MAWIPISDSLPEREELVWGYDCYYGEQGPCSLEESGRLIFKDSEDCFITHWKRVVEDPPTDLEIKITIERSKEQFKRAREELLYGKGEE